MSDRTIIKLSDLLTRKEISEAMKLLKSNKNRELKEYLNEPSRKAALEAKGVLSDYLYYHFQLIGG